MSQIPAYSARVTCMSYCYGGSVEFEVDEYPDDQCVVKYADHVAAVAEAVFQRGVDDADLYGEAIKAAVCDERLRIRKAVEALPVPVITSGRHLRAASEFKVDVMRVIDGEEKP